MARLIRTFIIILVCTNLGFDIQAQCSTNELIPVVSFESNQSIITVDGLVNDDLSLPNQGLCGVFVRMKHTQIGELQLKLKSPNGQEISLIGPQGSYGLTSNTNWAITFLPDALPVSPDPGFSDKWNSNQPWGVFGNYTGTYHPSNSPLESFDAGSANGDWIVTASDGFQFDEGIIEEVILFFCDNEGLSCNPCLADPGQFSETSITTCVSNADQVSFEPSFPDGEPNETYDFYYLIRQEDNILSIDKSLDVSSMDAGDYSICGLSLKKDFENQIPFYLDFLYPELVTLLDTSSIICGKLSTECVDLQLTPLLEDIVIDTSLCQGQYIVVENDTLKSKGYYEIEKDRGDSCVQKYKVNLDFVILEGDLVASASKLTCTDNTILIDAGNSSFGVSTEISWDTPNGHILKNINDTIIEIDQPGLYILNLQQGGCHYSSTINIKGSNDFPDLVFHADSLDCQNGSTKIDLTSNVSLQSVQWNGPNGFTSSIEDPIVSEPGEYIVSVMSDSGCETTSKVDIYQISSTFDIVLGVDSLDCLNQSTVILDTASTELKSYVWTGPDGFSFNGQNPEVNQIGSYYLTAQDSFGCIKEFQINVGGDLDSFPMIVHKTNIDCPGEEIDIAVSYEVNDPLISWTGPGQPFGMDSIITVNQVGDYSVELASNGCTVVSNFTIKDNFDKLPVAEPFQLDSLSCQNSSTILFSNITSNAGNVLSVKWSGPEGFSSDKLNPLVSQLGTYNLKITTISNCEVDFSYEVFTSGSFPLVDIDTSNINCARNFGEIILERNNYNDSLHVTGPGSYNSSNELIHSNLVAGSYTIEVYDSLGCKSEFIVPITYDTLAFQAEIIASNLLDCNHAELDLYTSKMYDTYNWSSSTTLLSNKDTLNVTTPGEIYLEVISSNACISRDTFNVVSSDNNINIIEALDKTLDCEKTSLALEVVADKPIAKYAWEGPDGFMYDSSNPIVALDGTYNVTITGGNGCIASEQIIVDIDTITPTIMTEFDHILTCLVKEATLSGGSTTPDVTYLWTGPSGFNDTEPAVSVTESGNYTFQVTGMNNCSITEELFLPFEGVFAETSTKNDTVFCKDNLPSVSVESNMSNVTYEWSGPGGFSSNQSNPVVAQPGTYKVTVTTDLGCETEDSALVIFKNKPPKLTLANPIDTLNCKYKEVLVDIKVDITTNDVSWTGPNGFLASNLDITVSEPGMYELVVEGYNNCVNQFEVVVPQDTMTPILDLSVDTINCNFPTVKINVSSDQNISQLLWTGPNEFTSTLLNNVDVFEKGVYTVNITGGNFCTNIDSIEVFEDKTTPDFTLQNDTLNCIYDLIALKLDDAVGTNIYSWSGPDDFVSDLKNPMVNIAGVYDVVVTGKNGCTSTSSLEVLDLNYYPEIACSKSGDITCIIPTIDLEGSEIDPGESRKWEGPNLTNITTKDVTVNTPGIYKYIVEGFTGCISEKLIEVIGDTIPPTILFSQIGEVRCEYDSVDIHALESSSGDEFVYSWYANEGNILDGNTTLNPKISGLGQYVLIIENLRNGCISRDSVDVEEELSTLEDFTVSVENISCHEDSLGRIIIEDVDGGFQPFTYAREGYSYDTLGVYEDLDIGKYNITVKDSFGCTLTKDFLVSKDTLFTVDLGEDVKIKLGEMVDVQGVTSLDFAQIDSIIWNPADIVDCDECLDFTFEPTANTKVILQIIDENGCINIDEKIILVDDKVEIYIPNIFSPNGDDVNDLLTVSNSKMVEEILSFRIYDRWGSVMHEEYNFIPGQGRSWDGKHEGEYVVNGVFPYILEMKLKNGKLQWKKGTITVVK